MTAGKPGSQISAGTSLDSVLRRNDSPFFVTPAEAGVQVCIIKKVKNQKSKVKITISKFKIERKDRAWPFFDGMTEGRGEITEGERWNDIKRKEEQKQGESLGALPLLE